MNKIRALVSEDLNEIDKRIQNFAQSDKDIFKSLRDFLTGSSKRIRSLISLLYLKANDKNVNEDVITLLFASELIHNASLLHDDVIDNSHERRGIKTLYDSYGSCISVLSGDYILSEAVNSLLKLNNQQVLKSFLNTTKQMSKSEINQYFNRNTDITLEQYLEIVKGKTGSLFSTCLRSTALLTGLDTEIAEKFGMIFGIIFQINNDMEEVSENNDRINGVKTVVDILGIEKTLALKDNYKEELSNIMTEFPENVYKQGIEDLIRLL